MSDFTEPDRRRRKRKGPRFQDPAALTLEERLSRLQRTLEARRTQYYEEPATKDKWMEQLRSAQAIMHGVADHPDEIQSSLSSLAGKSNVGVANANADVESGRENGLAEVHVVCLGIGKINESRESQYQFLHLKDLASFYKTTDVWIYDPLLEPVDILLIEACGYHVLPENRLGCYRLPDDRPAFAYLPHCPRGLYEAFIKENWINNALGWQSIHEENTTSITRSGRHMIIANDFKDYALSLPTSRFKAESPFLEAVVDILNVTPLPGLSRNHPATPAFSSLVWMHLPQANKPIPPALKGLLKGEVTNGLDLHFGDMVISDIGQSIKLQSEMIDGPE